MGVKSMTKPDYGTVQATLCTNLLRRGVVDKIIPREELSEWAQVLSDLACKPIQDESARLRAALHKMELEREYWYGCAALTKDHVGGFMKCLQNWINEGEINQRSEGKTND